MTYRTRLAVRLENEAKARPKRRRSEERRAKISKAESRAPRIQRATTLYPMSVRQQLKLFNELEHTSPCGSNDGDRPIRQRKVAKVHRKNNRGETPLHSSAKKGDPVKVMELITAGADVNAKDYAGWTPLHEACCNHAFDAARCLILNGAEVNVSSEDLDTPLHDAAQSSNIKITWLLLRNGANKDARNKDNERPIDLAEDNRVVQLLQSEEVPEECPESDEEGEDGKENTTDHPMPSPTQNNTTNSRITEMSSNLPGLTVDTTMDASSSHHNAPPPVSNSSILSAAPSQQSDVCIEASGAGLDLSDESDKDSNRANTADTSPQVSPTTPQIETMETEQSTPHSETREESTPPAERRGKSSEPDLIKRSAVWKAAEHSGSQSRAASPQTAYDFVEDNDDVRSESGFGSKRRGRGRGRGGTRAGSGTATPLVRKAMSVRGVRGRRGRGYARIDALSEAGPSGEDVYDFRETPESETDEREASLPPPKRFRHADNDADSTTGAGDDDGEDEEDGDRNQGATRKVPILRISLSKPAEDDSEAPYPRKAASRRPGGKKGADIDDDKRITRSKVRQFGRILDEEALPRKKNRRCATVEPSLLRGEDPIDELPLHRQTEPEVLPNIEDLPTGQQILYQPPHIGVRNFRKALHDRWTSQCAQDEANRDIAAEKNAQVPAVPVFVPPSARPLPSELEYDHRGAEFWLKQEEERVSILTNHMVQKQYKQRSFTEDFKRNEQRRNGTAPTMSAMRYIAESNLNNPMYLDDTVERPKAVERTLWDSKLAKVLRRMYVEHKDEADTLYKLQREELKEEWKQRGKPLSDELLNQLVYMIPFEELVLFFPESSLSVS